MTRLAVGLALASALAVAGCASEAPMFAGRTPFGGSWTVLSIEGEVIDERTRAPQLQFQVRGALQVVTRCSRSELPVSLAPPDGIAFGTASKIGSGQPCDPFDHAVEGALFRVLASVERFDDGRPGDRLTLSSPAGALVLAQPAANPTFCIDC